MHRADRKKAAGNLVKNDKVLCGLFHNCLCLFLLKFETI